MFDESTLKYFDKQDIKAAKLMTSSGFNPRGKGIDSSNIVRYMKLFYPDTLSSGTCVIDWEDSTFYNLRHDESSLPFNAAIDSIAKVLKIMKQTRPCVKVGVFDLPFEVYYPTADVYNKGNKFDRLFEYCDFIAPEIFIEFPDKEIGHRRNIAFIQHNLDVALQFGRRLNKPVIPFIWELIHPSNRKYGGMLIPRDEYESYAEFMMHYSYYGTHIKGFFLWTSSVPEQAYHKILSNNKLTPSKPGAIHARDSVLTEYYNGILKMAGK
ncbi:MAG: hypothetical protein ACTHK8_22965 [Ginsengibacter sp.]